MTAAIFLSYSSDDADAARRICDALRAAGLEVWFDQSELRGGDAWDASIRKQIKECALFVPVISANTNAREEGYFRLEWKLAVDRSHLMADNKAFFVPVILGDVTEPAALVPDKFRERQWSRLNSDAAIVAFAERIGKLLAGSASSGINASKSAPVLESVIVPSSPRKADEGFWVAVLPFKHRGCNAEHAAFAEGMSEEIVTGLARFSYLRVIARGVTLQLSSDATDVRAIGRALGARYVIEGTVRLAGATLRVAVQLIDAETGAHLWAETYERAFKAEDIFALQDDLVPRIVSTVADSYGVLPHSMSGALRGRTPDQLSPYEAVLRSFGYYERLTADEHAQVRACLEHAVERAPGHADCWAMLAMMYVQEHNNGYNVRPNSLDRTLAAAQRAVEAGPSNHLAHQALALVLFFRKEFQASRIAAERALALNPMDSSSLARMGLLIAYSGDWSQGCALLERARQLNPNHPGSYWFADFHYAYRQRDYRGALAVALKINMPGFYFGHAFLAATYAQLGDRVAATNALRDLLTLKPNIAVIVREEFNKWSRSEEAVEHLLDGLRKAGLDIPAGEVKPATLPASVTDASIAVLAFANRSASADDEYFSDGLADELLNVLAKIKGLRVAARTSAFSFKGKQATVAEIGRALNVATVLEGSVRKSGNRARISVQLVKVADGYQLWSETYDRTLDDIFAVQDDIAQSVVSQLRATLMTALTSAAFSSGVRNEVTIAAKGRSESIEAHNLLLQGRYLVNRRTRVDIEKGTACLRRALEIDPGNALTWAWLSRARSIAADFGFVQVEQANAEAHSAAERALALEPDLADGYIAMGSLQARFQWDFTGAAASLRRAFEIAPDNAEALGIAGLLEQAHGRLVEALEFFKRAIDLDPLATNNYLSLGRIYQATGSMHEAEHAIRRALEITPQKIICNMHLAFVLLATGRELEAVEAAQDEPAEYARLCALAIVQHALGKTDVSDRALQALIDGHSRDAAYQIAMVYAMQGDLDTSFAWLDRAFEQRDSGLWLIRSQPNFHLLYSDTRWNMFLKKLRLDN